MSRIVPRQHGLFPPTEAGSKGLVKQKGRKSEYAEFDLMEGDWGKKERLLDTDEIKTFVEVSCRAVECPMPLNLDVWDGFACPYKCIYCFANYFRASLYSSFFDNWKTMGMRHCRTDVVKATLDELRGGKGAEDLVNAFRLRIPARFGIRFEDFLPVERKHGVSHSILRYLRDTDYPVMINTKSDVVGDSAYVEALAENPSGAAVHFTLLTTDDTLSRVLDGSSPSPDRRLEAMRRLSEAGVHVVARIEPFMTMINDERSWVDDWIGKVKEAGVDSVTLDTYSYSAKSIGIQRAFETAGLDFRRMFLLMSDSQGLGSLLLSSFMQYLNDNGLRCSTFDFGTIPLNSRHVCCEVDESVFPNAGYNYGNLLSAARFIVESVVDSGRTGKSIWSWRGFCCEVEQRGGFLSEALKESVRKAWNLDHNLNYTLQWIPGMSIAGEDEDGLLWGYDPTASDPRIQLLESLV